MKVKRNVFLFKGESKEFFYVNTKKDGMIPVRYEDCAFCSNGRGEYFYIDDLVNGVRYYPSPVCREMQY